jgi:hypothetical protein
MAVVRLSRLDDLIPLSQLAQSIRNSDGGPAAPSRTATSSVPAGAPGGNGSKKNGMTGLAEGFGTGANGFHATPQTTVELVQIGDATLLHVWDKVKTDVGVMFAGQLARAGIPAIVGPKTLVLRFATQYNHAYDYCRDPGRTQQVEGVLKRLSGQDWAVRFELVVGSDPEPTAAPISSRERERRALETPLLSRIVSRLDGRLLKMDEGFGESPPAAEPVETAETSARPPTGEPGV